MSKIDKKTEIALMASIDADETVGAKSDEAFKTIARDKFFLAAIMKGTIPEYKDVSEEDIATKYIEAETISSDIPVSKNATHIKGLPEEDPTINEGLTKYDVVFTALAPRQTVHVKYKHTKEEKIMVKIMIDLEAQRNDSPGYPITKRAAYYDARMLGSEFDGTVEKINYNELYKVYSIWICFDAPDYNANAIYRIKQIKEDIIGSVEVPEYDYNLMESVIIMLGEEANGPEEERILEVLHAFFGKHNSLEDQIKKIEDLGFKGDTIKEAERMFSYSEMIATRNYKKGEESGIVKGKEMEHTSIMNAIKLARKMFAEGTALHEVAETCNLPEDELRDILL